MSAGPIGTALSTRFSTRSVCTLGGVVLGVSVMLSALAPSIEWLFFTHSALTGFGGALVYAPAIVIVGQYFDKRRSLALGISTAGSGLGIFAFAPIIEVLLEHYDYMGGLLITGALKLNACVSGALYRPLQIRPAKTHHSLLSHSGTASHTESPQHVNHKEQTQEVTIAKSDSNPAPDKFIQQHQMQSTAEDCKKRSLRKPAASNVSSICRAAMRCINLDLLRNKSFLLFTLATGLVNCAFQLPLMVIADHTENQGLGQHLAVTIISLVGITDTCGRVVFGLLMDLARLRHIRRHVYIAGAMMFGVINMAFGLSETAWAMLTLAPLCGTVMAVLACQRMVVATDIVGVDCLPHAVAILMFCQGLTLPIVALIVGQSEEFSLNLCETSCAKLCGNTVIKGNQVHFKSQNNFVSSLCQS